MSDFRRKLIKSFKYILEIPIASAKSVGDQSLSISALRISFFNIFCSSFILHLLLLIFNL
nr:MAG TPA: hypothetical protein [Caudoviricetes sp.]